MRIKIVNQLGEEKVFNSSHSFCRWNVNPKWDGELYQWYFESDHDTLVDVSQWIFADSSLDIRTHEVYLISDDGSMSENLIPINENKNVWMNYNPENPWLYLEIRTNYKGDGLGDEVD